MKTFARTTLLCCLTLGSFARAALAPEPAKITVQFRGSLKDGLRELAAKGGINLVVTGDLDQKAEVYLKDVSAEEALTTIAGAYHLKVQHHGTIWTLRPMTVPEKEEVEESKEQPETPEVPEPPRPPEPVMALPPPGAFKHPEREQERARRLEEKFKLKFKRRGGAGVSGTGPVVIGEGQSVEDAVSFAGSLTIKRGAVVEGDAVAFGGSVTLEEGATVEGDAVAFGGNVTLEEGASVEGDVKTIGGQVRKAQGATIEGDESSIGGLGAIVAKGVSRSAHVDEEKAHDSDSVTPGHRFSVASFLLEFAALFGLGFLYLMFAPARMKLIEAELARDPLKCGLTGLLGLIALIPLTVLLCITLVGIPVALLMWLVALPLALTMGMTAIAAQLGVRLPVLRSRKTQAIVLALGLLPMLLLAEIPVLGGLAMTFLSFVAFGAIIRSRFGQRPKGFPEPDTLLREAQAAP